jgi:RimJ/RimL family protein N-acetyltransferase
MSGFPGETPEEEASRRNRRLPDGRVHAGDLPAPSPASTILSGRLVRLEPADAHRHSPASLWSATHGDDIRESTWRYLSYGPFPSPDSFDTWFGERAAATDPMCFTALDAATNAPLGMVTLMRIAPEHGVVEIGNVWFIPEVRSTALTTEAIFILMRHAMEAGYRRLEWKCDARNFASRRAALRLGFRFEGISFNHMVIKRRNRDTAWFSITDDEWPAVRTVIHTWLDAANFDADGRERSSLRDATAALW